MIIYFTIWTVSLNIRIRLEGMDSLSKASKAASRSEGTLLRSHNILQIVIENFSKSEAYQNVIERNIWSGYEWMDRCKAETNTANTAKHLIGSKLQAPVEGSGQPACCPITPMAIENGQIARLHTGMLIGKQMMLTDP